MGDEMDRRPYSDYAFEYIYSHRNSISYYSSIMGVDPLAVAGSIGEEISDRAQPSSWARELLGDIVASNLGRFDIESGLVDRLGLGPGNIEIGTALDLIEYYQSVYPGYSDPLDLTAIYHDDPKRLVQDLLNENSDISIKLAAVMARQATDFFRSNAVPGYFDSLTRAEQAGLVVQFYNLGLDKVMAGMAANPGGYFPKLGPEGLELLEQAGRIVDSLDEHLCFAAGTRILLSSGEEVEIELVKVGDVVLSFEGVDESLVPRKVVATFSNITDTWIVLSTGLTVTPSHHFLDAFGQFRSIADILASDSRIVLSDGSVVSVTGEYFLRQFLTPARQAKYTPSSRSTGRTDLLRQATMADGSTQWVVQYRNAKGQIVTKDPDTGKILDSSMFSSGDPDDLPAPSKGPPGASPDGGRTVYLASGTRAEVGKIYSSPDGSTYKINADGSMTNRVTGQTVNSPGSNWGSRSGQQIGSYNTDTGWDSPFDSNSSSIASPIVPDLNGDGIDVDPLSSSNMFFDMAGDGKLHRTAWAGAGDGVLVRDAGNDGIINLRTEIDFTSWDPTAKSDLQALLNVFDTDHDGKLDAGDADWSLFKVMVTNPDGTTSLKTLTELGITSIDLISNNQEIVLADGSRIAGTSTFTKSDGSTGRAGDVRLVYESEGYVVTKTVTLNGDGSTTIVNNAARPDGSLAHRTTSTISSSGLSRTTEFDSDGDGVTDRRQTETRVVDGSGVVTETILDYDGDSGILARRQVTTTSADGKTTTVSSDSTGSGTIFDRVETRVTASDGSQTVTIQNTNPDGSARDEISTTTTADGLSKTVQVELTGSGAD
ncbi:hypothetical protein N8D56_25540 (plasmid) [Devosia sp. A8/3-2]|nr:hypothetical protein N8D56_25540 [Devosia sp. A8/3-2]